MKNEDLIFFMTSAVIRLRSEGRHGTAHVYHSTLNRIKLFEGRDSLPFKSITAVWLKAFEQYLIRQQLSLNTISTYMRMLRAVYNQAVVLEIAPYVPLQFSQVHTGTRVGSSRALDTEIMHRIMFPGMELPRELDVARNMFILLFLLRGISFVDLVFLRRCDLKGNMIRYRRQKTGRELNVRVEREAMEIIRKFVNRNTGSPYLFPFINNPDSKPYEQYQNALRIFNKRLQFLSVYLRLGVHLTSYCARHSWATIANFRHYDKELISNAMGHSSVKVTETYFQSYKDDKIDNMNRGIISYVKNYSL